MAPIIKQFEIGPMGNFGYLIGDEASRQALVVDPAWQADTIKRHLREAGLTLAGFAVTHAHFDHTNAIEELLAEFDVPVYAAQAEIPYSKGGASVIGDLGRTVKGVGAEETMKLGETDVTFLHTPGHTPGSQCIRVADKLLTGDTLFIGGCGRSDLPGGDAATLFRTLRKIRALPSDLEILPGHDYGPVPTRRLGEEREENPFLLLDQPDDFLKMVR